jgi:hypothetical protein
MEMVRPMILGRTGGNWPMRPGAAPAPNVGATQGPVLHVGGAFPRKVLQGPGSSSLWHLPGISRRNQKRNMKKKKKKKKSKKDKISTIETLASNCLNNPQLCH